MVKIGKREGITEGMPVSMSRPQRTHDGHGRRTKPKAAPKKVLVLVFLVVGDSYKILKLNFSRLKVFLTKL
jgi:hypothetical protein